MVCTDADLDGACDASTPANPNPVIVRNSIDDNVRLIGPAAGLEFTSTGTTTGATTYTLFGTWEDAPKREAQVALTGFIKAY